jgi:peptidoglycan/xylan/chitin deacetylase (PgdA/CDA1 family)
MKQQLTFPPGKRIAVTTSWDDGAIEDRRVVDAFNQWGLKGTFNLNSGRLGDANCVGREEVASLYANHEIAIHTVSHPHLTDLNEQQITREVLDDRKALEDLVGYHVRGMAYPYGDYDMNVVQVLRGLDIAYCRTVGLADPCFPPADPLVWHTTAHQLAEHPSVPQRWKDFYENPASAGVFFIWGHSWEFSRTAGWEALSRIFQPMAGHSDVWYCTNIELFNAHK